MTANRINWIDWGKVFAIYLVILGHLLSSKGAEGWMFDFVYLFHMPFFFFISGYLFSVKESKVADLLKRTAKSLLLPYLLLNLVSNFFLIPSWVLSKQMPVENLMYFLTADGRGESGPTWFLICLAWVWFIAWFLLKCERWMQYVLLLVCAVAAYLLPVHLFWRLDTALMVVPFFMVGHYLKNKIRQGVLKGLLVFVPCMVATVWMTGVMGYANTYLLQYGQYPLLYYPAAFLGIFMLMGFCMMFDKMAFKVIRVSSTGTILIMALHGIAILYVKSAMKHLFGIYFDEYDTCQKALLALVALIVLYYPIVLSQKYFPALMGNRGRHGAKQ